MVLYAKDYIVYWPAFFEDELSIDKTNALNIITSLLSNPKDLGLITIYINFISIFSQKFIQTLDFFQQKKPVFPLVENQLEQLTAYIETNMNAEYFGLDLDTLILSKSFRPADFYPIYRDAFNTAY